ENGGEVAVFQNGQWDAQLSSPASIAGLEQVATITTAAVVADKNGNESDAWVPFNERRAATLSAPSWVYGLIELPADEFGYFNLPGKNGGGAQVFAGGSNLAISANSRYPENAKAALKILLSEEYQSIL